MDDYRAAYYCLCGDGIWGNVNFCGYNNCDYQSDFFSAYLQKEGEHMAFFIVSTCIFVVTLLGFLTCLCLWVYEDAKVKSDQSPVLWVIIVLLVPNLVGLLIYLLVGRTNKAAKAPGKYTKLLIASAISMLMGIGLFVAGVVRFSTMQF